MIIRKTNFNDYKKIRSLVKKNNNNIPPFNKWKNIWTKNPNYKLKKPIADILLNNNKIYGYHSIIPKKLIYKKKIYKILVSSNWVVNKKYRQFSMQLLNKFFNMNADIYLTTTANKDVANIWEAFGATTVKPNLTNLVIYKILSPYNFIYSFFILKKKYVPKLIIKLLSCFLKIYLKRKIHTKEKLNLKLLDLDINDSYLENFNKNYENKIQEPSEKRSSYNLKWYLGLIKYDKKILIKKIIINNIAIGYVVIIAKNEKKINLKRVFIAEIKIKDLYEKYINEILQTIFILMKKYKYDVVEIKNLNQKLYKYIDKKNYLFRKYEKSPYLVKINKRVKDNSIYKNIKTTYLDGDCLL